MGAEYSAKAIDHCFKLYLKHNGQNHKAIEKGMHEAGWTGWSVNNLYNQGAKIGWIEKYGWKEALEKHLEQKVSPTLNSAEQLVSEIDELRGYLYKEIHAKGGNVDKERYQLFVRLAELSIAALTKVREARDTLSGWVNFFERFVDWAIDIDPKLARKLMDKSEEFIARAEKEFGEELASEEPGMNADANSVESPADDGTKD